MAALQERGGSFRVLFRHHGKQYSFPIDRVTRDEADATLGGVKETLLRLKQGFLKLHPGGDIVEFVQHKGAPPVTKDGTVVTGEADSPWAVVRGYHTLRHSFITACASRGIDQRLIQEWVGHLTAEIH